MDNGPIPQLPASNCRAEITVADIERMASRGTVDLTLRAILRFVAHHATPKVRNGRCIVMGNGPSLAEELRMNLPILQREKVFAVNLFALDDLFTVVRPAFYALMDPALSRVIATEWARANQIRILTALRQRTAWPMQVFFPLCPAQILLDEVFSGTQCRLSMVNLFPTFTIPVVRNLVYQTGLLLPPTYNVLVAATALAINMGFDEIYLIGADHSWLRDVAVRDDNCMYLVHRHFNGSSAPLPIFNRPHEPRRPIRVHEWAGDLYRIFHAYHILADYARHRDVRVYNATPDSFIDAFPRRRLSSIHPDPPPP